MSEPTRETVIVERSGGSAGVIIAVVAIIAVLVVGYLVFFNGQPSGGTVDIDVPAVSVDVVPDGQ